MAKATKTKSGFRDEVPLIKRASKHRKKFGLEPEEKIEINEVPGEQVVHIEEDDNLFRQEPDPQVAVLEAVRGLIGDLQSQALRQVMEKQLIEERWLDDTRQYHSRYDPDTEAKLKEAKRSKLFVGQSRTKASAWEARLSDLLYPTDGRNWGIRPTPVPTLADAAHRSQKAARKAAEIATAMQAEGRFDEAQQVAEQGTLAAQDSGAVEDEMELAIRAAELMEKEIDDQLTECRYGIQSRECIHDMVKIGTGVMKGPMVASKTRRSWTKREDGIYELGMATDTRPVFARVDPWNFFPDMNARTLEEAEFTYERHLWNEKDLKKAVKTIGLDADEVRDLLRDKPREAMPVYWSNLREITLNSQVLGLEGRYHVWEYHGQLTNEQLVAVAAATHDDGLVQDISDDPLAELNVIIWFCQGHLLKFGIHPLDSGETLYSACPFERDDTSIFGLGVPALMRDSQAAINAAWRMMMDNGGLSVGPQIVIDQGAITPVDGSWDLAPMKQWLMSSTSMTRWPEGYKPFQTFEINSRQDQLQSIINMARQFADDETNMPLVAYGEAATHVTQTSSGLAMMMNSANVVFRRVVKHFDDFMTVPNIRRAYDWNMQFNNREDIKGDFEVDARGSSVLLVRELQAQSLMAILMQFSAHPVLGPLGNWAEAFRKLVQSHMLHADEIVKSDEVIEREAEMRAQQAQELAAMGGEGAQQSNPDVKLKLDYDMENAERAREHERQMAEMQHETAMMSLAAKHNLTLDQLRAKLDIEEHKSSVKLAVEDKKTRSKERIFAGEVAVETRRAREQPRLPPGGKGKPPSGKGQPAHGSGGYI